MPTSRCFEARSKAGGFAGGQTGTSEGHATKAVSLPLEPASIGGTAASPARFLPERALNAFQPPT